MTASPRVDAWPTDAWFIDAGQSRVHTVYPDFDPYTDSLHGIRVQPVASTRWTPYTCAVGRFDPNIFG